MKTKREREREADVFRRYFCRENMEAYRCARASPLQSNAAGGHRTVVAAAVAVAVATAAAAAAALQPLAAATASRTAER